jgi:hypothetical protein
VSIVRIEAYLTQGLQGLFQNGTLSRLSIHRE